MTNEKRSEDIKNQFSTWTDIADTEFYGEVTLNNINLEDIAWLIEQAERTELYKVALEKVKEVTETDYSDLNVNPLHVIKMAVQVALEGDS